jgi:hypothetical protein
VSHTSLTGRGEARLTATAKKSAVTISNYLLGFVRSDHLAGLDPNHSDICLAFTRGH